MLGCYEYEAYGHKIILYNGYYHHYLSVDGNLVDAHNTLLYFSSIKLCCENNDLKININIPLIGKSSVNINGVIVKGKCIA